MLNNYLRSEPIAELPISTTLSKSTIAAGLESSGPSSGEPAAGSLISVLSTAAAPRPAMFPWIIAIAIAGVIFWRKGRR